MNLRADFQKSYLLRYAIIAGALLFFAAYFAYDGFIGYPANLPAARANDQLRTLDSEQQVAQWQTLAQQNGWDPNERPSKTAEEIEGDIYEQYFFGALCLLGGGIGLAYYLRSKGAWVEATEGGLTSSWGQSLQFSDVTLLDKKRWARKGIARATYTEGGVSRKFTFDDFKFEREPLGKILRSLEDTLQREQIVGGPTEEETDAQKALEVQAQEVAASEDAAD